MIWGSGVLTIGLFGNLVLPLALTMAVFWTIIYSNKPWILYASFISITYFSQMFGGDILGINFPPGTTDTALTRYGNFLGYFVFLLTILSGKIQRFKWLQIDTLLVIFVIYLLLSGLASRDVGATLRFFRRVPQFVALYVLTRVYLNGFKDIFLFIKLSLLQGAVITIILSWQFITGFLQQDLGRPHFAVYILPLYLGFVFIFRHKPNRYFFFSILLSFFTFFAASRRIFLSVVAFWGLMVFRGRNKIRALLIATFLTVGLFNFLPETLSKRLTATFQGISELVQGENYENLAYGLFTERDKLWRAGWKMWLSSPIMGVGTMNSPLYMVDFGAGDDKAGFRVHNYFLRILAEQGLIGFLIFTILYYRIYVYSKKASEFFQHQENQLYSMFVTVKFYGIVVFLVSSFFGGWGLYSKEQWFEFGIIVALFEISNKFARLQQKGYHLPRLTSA